MGSPSISMGSPLHLPHEGECSATTCSRILQQFIGFLLSRIWFSDGSDQSDQSDIQSSDQSDQSD